MSPTIVVLFLSLFAQTVCRIRAYLSITDVPSSRSPLIYALSFVRTYLTRLYLAHMYLARMYLPRRPLVRGYLFRVPCFVRVTLFVDILFTNLLLADFLLTQKRLITCLQFVLAILFRYVFQLIEPCWCSTFNVY